MMKTISRFLFGTLRGRLVISVAVVHAVMMSLFIADLTARQRDMLLDRQIDEAIALSQALATSSAGWMAADDIAGLQEIADAQLRYPEIIFVILTDESGRVLADTDKSRLGQYMLDLPREASLSVLSRTPALVDVAVPAMIAGRHVGWARVGIGQKVAGEKLTTIIWSGIAYAAAAILIGSVIAWLLGSQISRRLYMVQETIDAVRSGNRLARSQIAGTDESAIMAREFNSMLDTLEARNAELQASEERYRSLIQKVQTAIVLHDSQGRILTSNPLAQRLLGLSSNQLLGKELIAPEWRFLREDGSVMPVAEYPVKRVFSTRQPLRNYVAGISHPDQNDITWVLVNAEPEYNAAEEITLVIVSFVDITERKRAEAALRHLNRELRAISSCNEVLMRAVDEQTLLNDVSRIVCEEAGYRMAWVGYVENDEEKTVRPVAWAGNDDGYLANINITWADTERGRGPGGTAIRTGESACIQDFSSDPQAAPWRENALQRNYRSCIALPLKDENASVFGVLCIYSTEPNAFTSDEMRLLGELAGDLAFGIMVLRTRIERKRAEDALRENEHKLGEAARIAHVGYWDRDYVEERITLSDEARQIFGLSLQYRLLNLTEWHAQWLSLIHPEDQPGVAQAVTVALAGGPPYNVDYRVIRSDGDVRYIHSYAELTRDESGKPLRMFGTMIDITERKRAEDALRESETKFRAVFENSVDAIGVSKAGIHTFVNPAYLALFGYADNAELTGKPILDLIAPSHHAQILENVRRRASGQPTTSVYETRGLRKDGSEFDMDVHVSTYELNGEVYTVPIIRDITERKQAEQERLAHLRFFECMDQINRAIQSAGDVDQMMSDVLDIVLSTLDCDRAFLMVPCDPGADVWRVPMERNKPEYPGVHALGLEMAMSPDVAETLRILLASGGPVQFGPGTLYPLPADVSEQFGFKCFMSMAIYPRMGKPWQFGIHQCSHARVWTTEDEKLFQEIGRRLCDSLSSLLAYRDLRESEQRYRLVFEDSPVSIWEEDFSGVKRLFDDLRKAGVTDIENHFSQYPETIQQCADLVTIVNVNRAALTLHAASNKEELLVGLANTFTPESFDGFRQELICLWNGETALVRDSVVKTLAGASRNVTVYFSVCPGYEQTLSKILVSLADITERKRVEDALLFVAQRGWQTGAENFFDALAQFLGEKLEMDYVLIDKIDENPEMAETMALYAKGAITPNMRYALKGTPCENVMGRQLCVYQQGVQQLFPEDTLLVEMGAESYIGIPLWDSTGQPIGLIAVMGSQPISDDAPVTQLLQLVATRAAAELERERSDRLLRAREHEFRTLAENSPDVIVRYDRAGRRIYVNPEFERVNHLSAAQVLGKTPVELSSELTPKAGVFTEKLMAAMASGIPDKIDLSWNKDGMLVCWFVRVVPEFGANGNVVSALTIWSDISERKLAEERAARLAAIVESSDDAITGKTLDGIVTSWNKGAERIYGYLESEMIGKPVSRLVPPERADELSMILEKTKRGEHIEHYETVRQRKDGQSIDISLTISPLRDAEGRIIGVSTIGRDITERKRAEDVLKKSTAQLNEAQRIAHIGSWQLDIMNNVLSWSDEIYRMFEIDPAKFGTSYDAFLDTIHPDDRDAVNFAYTNSLRTKTPYNIEHRLLFADGRIKYVHEQCETLYDAAGNPIFSRGTVQDITERKQAEEKIHKLNLELEQRVLERTAQLEAANKELEAFAYSVSHDLRAPLRHIDGFLELLQKRTITIADEKSQHYMMTISDAAKRMGLLIDDLLSFSRMGRSEMSRSQVDLDELVQDVIREFRPDTEDKDIQWEISHLPLVTGDRAMLRIVLVNLISNALKFTRSRSQAKIEIGWMPGHETEATFFVRDNGVGFDMKYADKLFGVFQRLHRADEFEGTGIGLANVRRIIARHGGKTWAEGEVGQGATFYFSLPKPDQKGDMK